MEAAIGISRRQRAYPPIGTLLGLLLHWVTIGEPHYPSMDADQTIAYAPPEIPTQKCGANCSSALDLSQVLPTYPPERKPSIDTKCADEGAQLLKPLFIAGGTVMVVTLDLSMAAERWLRHRGRLAKNTSYAQEALSVIAILCSIAGAIGLILLTIFDTLRHPVMHDRCLGVFM